MTAVTNEIQLTIKREKSLQKQGLVIVQVIALNRHTRKKNTVNVDMDYMGRYTA